ncbi:MAG: WD40/YVTN/BNR-like repeat-containing protein [Chitinophagaceae bacterium]
MSVLLLTSNLSAQKKKAITVTTKTTNVEQVDLNAYFKSLKWRNVGPSRGGRSVASSGVKGNDQVYYMGTTGGGVWKTINAGQTWKNISDGFFAVGSIGAVAVSESDPNVVYVGTGEHAPRGVMTSYGDGVYKSTDAGKTWKKIGLELTRHISGIRIHPNNPDIVYVAAQGALHGPSDDRGIYKSVDGGQTWNKILYVDNNTGCVELSMDMNNPRILYAAMWDHRRTAWEVRSGGPGSGLYKSVDEGKTWNKLTKGIPEKLGKMSIAVSRANSDKVYALIEGDTQKEEGGLFVSDDGGMNFRVASKDHRLTQRAWYYIELFLDTKNENTLYVLNSPGLMSKDGGKTWTNIRGTHGDYHHIWVNPDNPKNLVISNDGGAAVTFDQTATWSTQNNQPTAQFYRVNADDLFPYNLYAGQQDNTSVRIKSRTLTGYSITDRDWNYSAGGESAFLAFDPKNPKQVMGGSYQGTIEMLNTELNEGVNVMQAPIQYQALMPKDMKYRFNWNAPIIYSQHDVNTFYHGANVLFRTTDLGKTWTAVSGDLTRNDKSKQGMSGTPYTNEGAGGENYGTLLYILESTLEKGVIYTGSDDGFVHITKDNGATWTNITPEGLQECMINSIEVSPHDKATVYIATTRYKFNDFAPAIYKSADYGKTWTKIVNGISPNAYTRVVREDSKRKGLLYAGTETGLYISFDAGQNWKQLQLGLPIVPITDLKVHHDDLLASTMGRAFWILDDIEVLRAFDEKNQNDVQLYPVNNVVRVSAGSTLDQAGGDEDEDDVISAAGTNPASGAVFYFQLPANFKDSAATIEIINSRNEVVRSYSSKAEENFQSYPGGPKSDPVISLKKGLNRFVWDLRGESIKGVPTVFIEGSFSGYRAAPGKYTVKLKIDTITKQESFQISALPGMLASNDDFLEQEKLMKLICDETSQIHTEVISARKWQSQLKETSSLLTDKKGMESIRSKADALVSQLKQWEDDVVQNKAKSNDDIINYVNRITADYIFLKGEMDSNIPFITKGQKDQFDVLHQQWLILKGRKDAIQKNIQELNEEISKAQVGRVII